MGRRSRLETIFGFLLARVVISVLGAFLCPIKRHPHCVWLLDRLGHSLGHLIETVRDLRERSVHFRSLQEQLDTATSGGKLIFHVFGALAEFEVLKSPGQFLVLRQWDRAVLFQRTHRTLLGQAERITPHPESITASPCKSSGLTVTPPQHPAA